MLSRISNIVRSFMSSKQKQKENWVEGPKLETVQTKSHLNHTSDQAENQRDTDTVNLSGPPGTHDDQLQRNQPPIEERAVNGTGETASSSWQGDVIESDQKTDSYSCY